MSVSRRWVFTINNYTEADCGRIRDWAATDECVGISAGLEVGGKSGTPHIQGFLIAGKSTRKTYFYKTFRGDKKCKFWMDVPRGDWAQNAKYTTKDQNVLVWKVPPQKEQGRRMDLEDFHAAIKRKPEISTDELIEEGHLHCLAKYPRLRNELRFEYGKLASRPFRAPEVHVRWGAAGTGKTRGPYEEGAFMLTSFTPEWWDGYDGDEIVLFDDYYGEFPWGRFLKLLDGYQCRLPTKGGHTWSRWTKLYITSNKHPKEWYPDEGFPHQFKRRLTSVTEFKVLDGAGAP